MNLRQAKQELLASAMAGNAVLLVSPSGLGKSQLGYQTLSTLKAKDRSVRWGYGVIFAATQTPPDLIGYQFKGDKVYPMPDGTTRTVTVTDPSVPLWMMSVPHEEDPGGKPAWMYDKFYLIIEEYGQGEADVKRAVAEIFLNGGTAPWYLPEGSVRLAFTNEGSRYGVTKDFDFCIARRTMIKIHGDVEVWLNDFADKPYRFQGRTWMVPSEFKAWAASNPTILFEPEPKEQGPWCNPRTLTAAGRYYTVKQELNGGKVDAEDPLMAENFAGTIGMPATQSLIGTLRAKLNLPSYEEVVSDPMNTKVPTKADDMMLMSYQLAGWTRTEHLAQCIQYMQRIPAQDMQITYVSALLRRDYKHMVNQPAMQGWIAKNAALVSIIASLSS